jgi:beta-N-acetylhexosaminidase
MRKKLLTVLAAMMFSLVCVSAKEAANIIDGMPFEQIIGQTIFPRLLTGEQEYYKDAIKQGLITGVFLKTKEGYLNQPSFTPEQQAEYIAEQRKLTLQTISDLRKWEKESPHGIPLLIAVDYEGGPVTSAMYLGLKQIPSNMLLAAAADEELISKVYSVIGKELKSIDAQIAFVPVLDTNTNPANPIIGARSFGSDSAKIGKYGVIASQALQEQGIAPFAKHFPGHGDVAVDSHLAVPFSNLPMSKLRDHINAFVPSITNGIWGIMTCHVVYNAFDSKNTATFSKKIITGLLKNKLKFKGVVATDDLGMKGASQGKLPYETVLRASRAGADLLLISGDANDAEAVSQYPKLAAEYINKYAKRADKARIIKSAKSIIDLKKKTGLFNNTGGFSYDEKEFYSAVRKTAEKGVTLARNAKKTLPVNKEQKEICSVFFADSIFGEQLKHFSNVLSANGKNVSHFIGAQKPSAEDAEKALQCAQNKDLVIIGSLQRYVPIEEQKEVIEKILASSKNVILISLLSPYDISLYPQAETVIAVYGPTKETMEVAAEIILGKRSSLGKLPVALGKE